MESGTVSSVLLLSLGVAVSPLPLIAIVALLLSERPKPTSLAFTFGWLVGIVAVLGVALGFALHSGRLGLEGLQRSAAVIGIAVGVLAMLAGAAVWFRRPASTADGPGWMRALDTFTPPQALGFGAALSAVNPKNLLASGTAGLMLGWSGLPAGQAVATAAVFCVLAGSSVLVPVVVFFAGRADSRDWVLRTRDWLVPRQTAVLAIVLASIGALLVLRGLLGS